MLRFKGTKDFSVGFVALVWVMVALAFVGAWDIATGVVSDMTEILIAAIVASFVAGFAALIVTLTVTK